MQNARATLRNAAATAHNAHVVAFRNRRAAKVDRQSYLEPRPARNNFNSP